jgi:hypothetical protein
VTGHEPGTATGTRKSNALSNVLAVVAIAFAVIAAILFYQDGLRGSPPVPTAAPGDNQLANVVGALQAQGLEVRQPPRLFIPRGELEVPGQGIEIEGMPAFVFLYPNPEAARQDVTNVDPAGIVPERIAGTPTPSGERRMAQGSNVAVLLVGGDAQTWQDVETAVASLS